VDVYDRAEALDVITRSISDYQKQFGDRTRNAKVRRGT
jgi:hypothetical protein